METVISANKFLDLLSCVVPAASNDETRKYIYSVQLEVIASEYAIRAVATDGAILSVAQRELGFSTESQADFEDIEGRNKIVNATWLLSVIDAELLMLSLRKLGVKRKEEDDETGGRYYIAIRETPIENITEDGEVINKKKLSISILGLSHVVLEPTLVSAFYPDWKKLLPKEEVKTNYISFNLAKLALLNKCWGNENIFMSFFAESQITKITRNSDDQQKEKDFIMLMPLIKKEDDKEKIDKNQMNFFN